MENIYPRIKQVSVSIDKNTVYKFDVNQSVSIRKLKKMIISAANLQKSGLRLFHNSIDYSKNDLDTLQDLFPSLNVIEFNVTTDASHEHNENEKHIKLKFGKYCPKHEFKYAYFFCYDCSSSLCSLCLQTENHTTHNYIEKYDYLQSSRNLVETIFYDLKEYSYEGKFNDAKLDEMRTNIKNKVFPSLRELIDRIEKNILELFDFYYEAESVSFKNLQKNVSELKKHCTEGLDKLKSEI